MQGPISVCFPRNFLSAVSAMRCNSTSAGAAGGVPPQRRQRQRRRQRRQLRPAVTHRHVPRRRRRQPVRGGTLRHAGRQGLGAGCLLEYSRRVGEPANQELLRLWARKRAPLLPFTGCTGWYPCCTQVLEHEYCAIVEACRDVGGATGYRPDITFVVVQKRHATRLLVARPGEGDRTGNIHPGAACWALLRRHTSQHGSNHAQPVIPCPACVLVLSVCVYVHACRHCRMPAPRAWPHRKDAPAVTSHHHALLVRPW